MESYRHRSIANKAGGHASWVVFVFSRKLGAVEEVQSRERKAKGIGSSPSVSCEPCMYAEYAIDQSIVAEQSVRPWTTMIVVAAAAAATVDYCRWVAVGSLTHGQLAAPCMMMVSSSAESPESCMYGSATTPKAKLLLLLRVTCLAPRLSIDSICRRDYCVQCKQAKQDHDPYSAAPNAKFSVKTWAPWAKPAALHHLHTTRRPSYCIMNIIASHVYNLFKVKHFSACLTNNISI